MKGKPPNEGYQQTDTYGSWRDMSNTGLRNGMLKINPELTQKQLPQHLRGEVKAGYCPIEQTDWLLGENKAY